MSRHAQHFLYLARITLEVVSPLSVSSGRHDALFDALVVQDANGLPLIPGTALAGVLRSAQSLTQANSLFGFQSHGVGQTSRVEFTHAHIHDASNKPVDGLVMPDCLDTDRILGKLIKQLPFRDHVKLNKNGVAEEGAKFDRSYVPVGHRFTFDLRFWSESENDPDWQHLLDCFANPLFRLGGATRRGYGLVKPVCMRTACIDLHIPDAALKLADWPRRLDQALPAWAIHTQAKPRNQVTEIRLDLKAVDFWMIGGGSHVLDPSGKKAPDHLQQTQECVVWTGDRACVLERKIVVPASSIKGALRHRFAYHWRRIKGLFAGDEGSEQITQGEVGLFGNVDGQSGVAGAIWIDDLYLPAREYRSVTLAHTSIDRFTGGVRRGVLFQEEAIWQGPQLQIRLLIDMDAVNRVGVEDFDMETVQSALVATLDDLSNERLALGYGAAKGHGFFKGDWNLVEQGEAV